jgi:hypothetical protein
VRGDGRDAGSAERSESAEAVVDEIETIGNGVEVGVGIEVEGGGADDGDEMEEAGEAESDEEIDTESAEDGFGIGMIAREDALEDHAHNENVEAKAKSDVGDRENAGIGLEDPDVLRHRWNAEKNCKYQERAAVTDGVNAEEDDATAHDAEQVVAEGGVVGEGIEDEGGDEEDEEEHVATAGRRGSG